MVVVQVAVRRSINVGQVARGRIAVGGVGVVVEVRDLRRG